MKRCLFIVIIISLIVFGSFGIAKVSEANDKLSKYDSQILDEFNLSFKDSADGRFQTTKIDETSILIIDTRLGHLWVLRIAPNAVLKYAGKVRPGPSFWDTINKND